MKTPVGTTCGNGEGVTANQTPFSKPAVAVGDGAIGFPPLFFFLMNSGRTEHNRKNLGVHFV